MQSKEIVDKILESLRAELTQFVEEQDKIKDPVEYEERVIALSQKFSKGLIKESMGKLSKSRNLKKR